MNTNKMDPKVFLSTLWIFVMFNYLYCDVMGLMDPVILNQMLAGDLGFVKITEGFLLGAAVLMEIPIAMVLLSRILNYSANRWANIIAGTIKTVVMIMSMFVGDGPTLYYLFFGTIEMACTAYIVWYAWNWHEQAGQPEQI
ncbi:DUF6326 family protein [Candidatus Neomarinimicrobiota bacterium]